MRTRYCQYRKVRQAKRMIIAKLFIFMGLWSSWLARRVVSAKVAGSSPVSPVSPKPYLKSLALLKKEKELKEKKKELERQQLKEQGFKVDSLGRVLTWAPTENEWIKRKELILNCGIDITKFGWVGKVEKATGLSKRIIETTVLHFNLNVFKRKCNKNDN